MAALIIQLIQLFFFKRRKRGILVTTMHASKGLEFDAVWIPHSGQIPDDEEERRLLYVAITRAKDHLLISGTP